MRLLSRILVHDLKERASGVLTARALLFHLLLTGWLIIKSFATSEMSEKFRIFPL